MIGRRVEMKDAPAEFGGKHVVFTEVERDASGAAVSGAVAGVFDSYEELSRKCKSLKCDLEVGLFGPSATYSGPTDTRASSAMRVLKTLYRRAAATSVPAYLLHHRHDNIGESWAEFVGASEKHPLIARCFPFMWLKDWLRHGGYTLEDIEESFLYRTAWLHRNTVHGIVKGDAAGILQYAESVLRLYRHIAGGGKVDPLKLKRHSGAHYEVVDGHHRAACMMLAGRTKVEAIVAGEDGAQHRGEFERIEAKLAERGKQPYYDFGISGLNHGKVAKKDSLKRFEMILRHIPLVEDLTLLDVGCHTGLFTVLFGCYGLTAHGINPSEGELSIAAEYAELIGSRATFQQATLGKLLNSNDNGFDVTLMLNVFYSVIQADGKESAVAQLRGLLGRTRRRFFFSTSMPGDNSSEAWKPYAMSHDEITGILSGYGRVTAMGQDADYRHKIYKVEIGAS
ncbi:MAG: methyltransferase domain-containing protein [Chloroflexi bacterium]|nr:methyltransferase domain-containing protein [Chloroflexota bacterium]